MITPTSMLTPTPRQSERTALIAPYLLDRALPELASRQQLSAALNEGVLVKDADDCNVWFNAAACRLLARTPDEMLGPSNNRDSWSIHGPDLTHLPDARWPFQVARETGRPVAGVLVRGDDGHGRPIWLAMSATPTRRGDEAATIVVFRDVTPEIEHRLQLERTLVEINRTLVQEHLPRPALVDFAARIHTSGGSRTISGDFFGVHEIEPGLQAFYIGDVCGHDIESAGVSSLARHTLRSAGMLLSEPDAVLRHLHDVLDRDGRNTFVTAIFGFVDARSGRVVVRFAVAGHPLPVVVGDAGVRECGSPGPIVGMVHNAARPVTTVELDPGQRLILFTDGLLRTTAGECDGVRLLAGLRPGWPVDTIADDVLAIGDHIEDARRQDDVAVLVIGA